MSVTDGDREKALVVAHKAAVWGPDAIAKALAEEREKARAPFLALADEYEQEDPRINRNTMAIFRAVTHDLRRAAEDNQ